MRAAFSQALVDAASSRAPVFFTGDLGFGALEPLQARLGPRFINAGVAEQNMVSMAAGVASLGEQCWVYSIAPFVYGRPFEQIRNDVCLHDFDVKLVGNGGGYGYGVMGASHHALEDYGVLLTLQNMRAVVPAFADDVAPAVERLSDDPHPAYLRLGRCEKPPGLAVQPYAPWRVLLPGLNGVLVVVGPIAGPLLLEAAAVDVTLRPEIWVVTELPIALGALPRKFMGRLASGATLSVVEEHVAQGGVGPQLLTVLAEAGVMPRGFRHFCARGYPSGRYGSQAFHRRESGIDARQVLADLATSVAA